MWWCYPDCFSAGEPEATFMFCCDVEERYAFERMQLYQFRAQTGEKQPFIHFFPLIAPQDTIMWDYLWEDGWRRPHGAQQYTPGTQNQWGCCTSEGCCVECCGQAKKEKEKSIFCQSFNSNTWKEDSLAVWNNPNWHAGQKIHTHTPLSERCCREVKAGRDVQVIDNRVTMNWN